MTLQQAIAKQEGFGKPGARPTLLHNPGDIIYGTFATSHGAVGNVGGYAEFPDDASGWAALTALLSGPSYRDLTVEQAIDRYCPAPAGSTLTEGNQPDVYVQNICEWCDCSPTTPIADLLG
jgi:hypothetical protein